MRIAILGASSQIAKDLICSFASTDRNDLLLYVRNHEVTLSWVKLMGLEDVCSIHNYESYGGLSHEVVINFVGVGDPMRAAEMGASIFEVTSRFDEMVMKELSQNPSRRYFFLSSGAVYGNSFDKPVTAESLAQVPVNDIGVTDYYAIAKLNAELRHRSRPDLSIIDLRVFNIFSRTQNIKSRFFITDVVRAIVDNSVLHTSSAHMVRDFIHPEDFHQLIDCLMEASPSNCALDCYSREPIDKAGLLKIMNERFGLKHKIVDNDASTVNATGLKTHYYSKNRKAAEFGYEPTWSSLDCIVAETTALLNSAST